MQAPKPCCRQLAAICYAGFIDWVRLYQPGFAVYVTLGFKELFPMYKEEINYLAVRVSEELNKYTHLLLTFSVAAIAYTLNQAQGKPISYESAFLAITLASWCISTFFGTRHLQLHRAHMIENAKSLLRDESMCQMLCHLEPIEKKMQIASSRQYRFLLIGVTTYVAWHVACALRA